MSILEEVAKNKENERIAQIAKDKNLESTINTLVQEALVKGVDYGKQQVDKGLAEMGFQAGVQHGIKRTIESLMNKQQITI